MVSVSITRLRGLKRFVKFSFPRNIENENPESTENTTPIASSAPTFEQNSELQKITTGIRLIKGELNKVIVGQTQLIDGLIIAILANGNCLIEGVPGIAKTLCLTDIGSVITLIACL